MEKVTKENTVKVLYIGDRVEDASKYGSKFSAFNSFIENEKTWINERARNFFGEKESIETEGMSFEEVVKFVEKCTFDCMYEFTNKEIFDISEDDSHPLHYMSETFVNLGWL